MGWELTPPSHGSRPIGLPTKLLRSKRSADEAAEPSENSTNPHRISGVPLILPSGEVSCVRVGGVAFTCARARRRCARGAWLRGVSVAYCVRRIFPWNSKKERSSADVASRWMLPTFTLVLSITGRAAASNPADGLLVCYHPSVPAHTRSCTHSPLSVNQPREASSPPSSNPVCSFLSFYLPLSCYARSWGVSFIASALRPHPLHRLRHRLHGAA